MRKNRPHKRVGSPHVNALPLDEDVSYLADIAPGYRKSELLQLHREMMAMADLLIGFYLTRKQSELHKASPKKVEEVDK